MSFEVFYEKNLGDVTELASSRIFPTTPPIKIIPLHIFPNVELNMPLLNNNLKC